jgi:hypothetical protein
MPSSLHAIRTIFGVFLDALTFIRLCFMPTTAVVAENLFLRKQPETATPKTIDQHDGAGVVWDMEFVATRSVDDGVQ